MSTDQMAPAAGLHDVGWGAIVDDRGASWGRGHLHMSKLISSGTPRWTVRMRSLRVTAPGGLIPEGGYQLQLEDRTDNYAVEVTGRATAMPCVRRDGYCSFGRCT
jgi:hypothetical protein